MFQNMFANKYHYIRDFWHILCLFWKLLRERPSKSLAFIEGKYLAIFEKNRDSCKTFTFQSLLKHLLILILFSLALITPMSVSVFFHCLQGSIVYSANKIFILSFFFQFPHLGIQEINTVTFTSIQSHAQHKYFLFFCLQILLLLVVFFYSPEVQIILMSLMCFDQPSGLQAINLFVIHPGVLASDFSILLCEKNFPFLISCSRCGWNSLSFGIDRRY